MTVKAVGSASYAEVLCLRKRHEPEYFQLIVSIDAQRRVAFLPGVPLTLKSLRKRDYSERPRTLGEHLKKRRKELGLLQREAAERLGCDLFTYINWEKDRTQPLASRFRPVLGFLGYDPMAKPRTLAERLLAKRRATGMTFEQVANQLGWDSGTLTRYLNGTWPLPAFRARQLQEFLVNGD